MKEDKWYKHVMYFPMVQTLVMKKEIMQEGKEMKFNELLQKTRLERSISIEDLSKEVAASESTIQKYEEGTVMPDVITLVRICKALKVTPNDLLLDVSFSSSGLMGAMSQWPRGNFLKKEEIDLRKMTQEEQIKYVKTRQKRSNDAICQGLRLFGLTPAEAEELMEKARNVE